jgi:hypothetical protein
VQHLLGRFRSAPARLSDCQGDAPTRGGGSRNSSSTTAALKTPRMRRWRQAAPEVSPCRASLSYERRLTAALCPVPSSIPSSVEHGDSQASSRFVPGVAARLLEACDRGARAAEDPTRGVRRMARSDGGVCCAAPQCRARRISDWASGVVTGVRKRARSDGGVATVTAS